MRTLSPLLVLLVTLRATGVSAGPERGYRTGGAHFAMVTATPTEGLEVGIPRDSAYARGIALDMLGKWDESYKAYQQARQEFQQQLKSRPRWVKMIRGWVLKAQHQMDQSRALRQRHSYYRYSRFRNRMTVYRAMALHNKWLGIRAFTGQSVKALRNKVIAAYKEVIRQSSYDDRPKLGLAAMYHEIGKHAEGRKQFARARYTSRSHMAKHVAYYYAAAGQLDKAFEHVETAVKYSSSNRRWFLMSNDLDRLRADARFRKLVGEP
jgi:tetratricopeptide (TPR) repeat protein